MPDWLICLISGLGGSAVGVGVAWGGFSARLRRVEQDVSKCVTREVYAAQQSSLTEKLTRIETMVERLFDRHDGFTRTPQPR